MIENRPFPTSAHAPLLTMENNCHHFLNICSSGCSEFLPDHLDYNRRRGRSKINVRDKSIFSTYSFLPSPYSDKDDHYDDVLVHFSRGRYLIFRARLHRGSKYDCLYVVHVQIQSLSSYYKHYCQLVPYQSLLETSTRFTRYQTHRGTTRTKEVAGQSFVLGFHIRRPISSVAGKINAIRIESVTKMSNKGVLQVSEYALPRPR